MATAGTVVNAIEQLPGGKVQVGSAVVRLASGSGLLVCSNHPGQIFCDHIELAIKEHADYSLLGAPDTEWQGTALKIPLVPSKDQWADVKIGDYHEATQSYKLYLTRPGPAIFLGFLQKGEGRAVIRSMVYDWFRANLDPAALKCKASSHKYSQELTWRQHTGPTASPVDQFAEYWCVYVEKMCVSCHTRISDFDDLVPDAGGKKW